MICWQCHEPTGGAVCVSCGALQLPPATNDPYAVLGLNRVFHIEDAEIDIAWRALSRKIHPDRWTGQPAVYRRMSLQWTALANEARRILRDPLSRARYLATGDSKPAEIGGVQPDADFLEQMFDLQMMRAEDPEGTKNRVDEMWNAQRDQLDQKFRLWEADQGSLEDVEMILAKLQYLNTARNHAGA